MAQISALKSCSNDGKNSRYCYHRLVFSFAGRIFFKTSKYPLSIFLLLGSTDSGQYWLVFDVQMLLFIALAWHRGPTDPFTRPFAGTFSFAALIAVGCKVPWSAGRIDVRIKQLVPG